MKNSFALLFLALIALLAFQCNKEEVLTPEPPQGVEFSCTESPQTCELTAANGDFAIKLFKKLHQDEPGANLFISPFSISTALTMTANGANGQTLEEMRTTLEMDGMEMADINTSFQELLAVLPALDPQSKLKLANSIWPKENYPVLPSFLDLNANYYQSEIIPVDFKDPAVLGQINQWIEENTDGLIQEALNELPPDVVMLLINAIYFKGVWQTEFDPEATYKTNFYASGGTEEVDMMHIPESDFPYFSTELFQAIDLPYGDSIFSMSIFLPREGHTVEEVIAELNPENWKSWIDGFVAQPVQLHLPKFELEYEIKLKRPLSDLGMENAFTFGADFSHMIDGGGVMIDDVIHKAFVEVNEEGTEAAAVTIVIIVETSVPSIPTVLVNKPFMFVIRDNQTHSILFMGKVMNPNG